MKVKRILLLCGVAALPQLAMAGTDESPQALGAVRAILDYCSAADPHDAASFQAIWKNVSGGASVGDGDYQQSYTQVSNELGKFNKHNAAKICATGAKSFPLARDNDHRTSGVTKRRDK